MYIQKVAERFRRLLVTLADSGLEWGVCHSDIGNDNLLVTNEEEVTAVDFDLAGPGWLAWDFVSARSRASHYEDEGIWHSFVLGYSEVRRIAECDLAAVSLLGVIRRLWSMGMRARLVRLRGDTHFSASYVFREVALFRQWEGRHEAAD
jgi:Ser/Thr protein kinase RdoA (MazF antagonist)